MKSKISSASFFSIKTMLIVLSVVAFFFGAVLIYTGIFYEEAKKGMGMYVSENVELVSFAVVYMSLLVFFLLLIMSLILMWMRKRIGVFLYFFWSFLVFILLMLAEQVCWINIFVLALFVMVFLLNFSYFPPRSYLRNLKED